MGDRSGADKKDARATRAIEWMVEKRLPAAVLRAVLTAAGVVLGALITNIPSLAAMFAVLIYVTVFLVVEHLFADTSARMRKRVEREVTDGHNAALRAIECKLLDVSTELELYWGAQQKISFRIGKTAETIAAIVKMSAEGVSRERSTLVKKDAIIDEALGDLCEVLESTTSKRRGILRPESWFRATYMEVRDFHGTERLAFIAYHTPDGAPPTSMSKGITCLRGEGDAGIAWDTRRPVIEDNFQNGHGWRDFYPGQGRKYKSMICVPVWRGSRDMAADVIGVITIDTRIPGFFGKKDDQEDEDRFAGIVRPYSSYIAVISALTDALKLPGILAASPDRDRIGVVAQPLLGHQSDTRDT